MSIYQVTRIGKNGEPYSYWQESRRVNGKVKTFYRGPVVPKRPGLSIGDIFANILGGAAHMGALAVAGKLGPPGGKPSYGPAGGNTHGKGGRAAQIAHAGIAEVNRLYGVDMSSREAFNETRGRMSPEMFKEYNEAQTKIWHEYHQSKFVVEQVHDRQAAPVAPSDAVPDGTDPSEAPMGDEPDAPEGEE